MKQSNGRCRMGRVPAGVAALCAAAVGLASAPALARDWCGVPRSGVSFQYTSIGSRSAWSIGVSSPVVYASSWRGGGWYDCGPRYYYPPAPRYYYRPAPRYYYTPPARYYYQPTPRYRRSYDCGPSYYWSGAEAVDGLYLAGGGVSSFRNDTMYADVNLAPSGGFRVVREPTPMERAADLDPQWAGGAIAMLRKGQVDAAVVALEQAAYPEMLGIEATASERAGPEVAEREGAAANPEAVRMLGVALIADGRIDEGTEKIAEAYRLDPTLASSPLDERLFPREARFEIRDLIRKVSVRANRTNASEAWLTLGALMQAEGRDSLALDMVLKASAAGMEQEVVSPMADAMRRVVYGRR